MPKRLPAEAVVTLRRRLQQLAPGDPERSRLLADTARLHGISRAALYRQLREQGRPRALHRANRGRPRVLPRTTLQRYGEIIAALKLRATNGKGRHLSTPHAIVLREEHLRTREHADAFLANDGQQGSVAGAALCDALCTAARDCMA